MLCARFGTRSDLEDIPALKKVCAKNYFVLVFEFTPPTVWPVIATHLEFKPQSSGLVGNDKEDSRQT
jgi:hypothetical protein